MNYIKIGFNYNLNNDTIFELRIKGLLKKDQSFTLKSSQFQQDIILKMYDYSKDGYPILELDEKIEIDKVISIETTIIDRVVNFDEVYPVTSIIDSSNRYKLYQESRNILLDYLLKIHNITKDMIEDSDVKQLIRDVKISMIND